MCGSAAWARPAAYGPRPKGAPAERQQYLSLASRVVHEQESTFDPLAFSNVAVSLVLFHT